MALDFRTDQLQVEKIIGVNDQIVVLPQSASTDSYGGIAAGLLASLSDPKIFFFVSGAKDSVASGSFGTSVFGGDVVFSGSVYIEGTISGSGIGGGETDRIVNATADSYVDADPADDGSDKSILMYSSGTQVASFNKTMISTSFGNNGVEYGFKAGIGALLGFYDAASLFANGPSASEQGFHTTILGNPGATNSIVQSIVAAGDLGGNYSAMFASRERYNAGSNEKVSALIAAGTSTVSVTFTDEANNQDNNRVKLSGDIIWNDGPAQFDGNIRYEALETTGNITASLETHHILLVNCSTGPKSIILPIPTSSQYHGTNFIIKDVAGSSSLNNITIQSENTGSYKIDGDNSYILSVDYASVTLLGRSSGDWTII